jgi:peptidoglycan/xylan/chitin deacetylase (PgdA/CDA1 family)
MKNKRAMLAGGLGALGLWRLLERVARRPGLVVLCYHRLGEPGADPFYDPLVSATPEGFRAQVRLLRDAFPILHLDELVASGALVVPDRPAALITFDDGTRDHLDVAVPILRELGVPAAFFLATGLVGGSRLAWWDRVAHAVKTSPADRLRIEQPEPIDLALGGIGAGRSAAVAAVVAAFGRSARPDDPEALAHLEARAGVAPDGPALARRLFLSWDDARRLAAAGMAVGAHTRTHPRLADLPEADQEAELSGSRADLERELGREVRTLAYPYGDARSFDATTARLARAAGYRAAFALTPGVSRPGRCDPFALPRLNVMAADSPALLRARAVLVSARGRSPL